MHFGRSQIRRDWRDQQVMELACQTQGFAVRVLNREPKFDQLTEQLTFGHGGLSGDEFVSRGQHDAHAVTQNQIVEQSGAFAQTGELLAQVGSKPILIAPFRFSQSFLRCGQLASQVFEQCAVLLSKFGQLALQGGQANPVGFGKSQLGA